MKTYRVQTHELIWHNCVYEVEAESEEEAREIVEDCNAYMIDDQFDTIEQVDIEDIVEII